MKNAKTYQTPVAEILVFAEDVISTSAIELPFIPMSLPNVDEEQEI